MDKRYDKIMEHVEVTPEMRQRILKQIEQMDPAKNAPPKVIAISRIRRLAVMAACLAVVLVGALTLPSLIHGPDHPDGPGVLAPGNGIIQVASVEELSEIVGFEVAECSHLPFQVEGVTYTAYWKELAEIVYSGEGQIAVWRMGIGTEDVSGDYNNYDTETEISVGSTAVTLKGNGGIYTLAIWAENKYAYSISLSDGLTENEWQALFD